MRRNVNADPLPDRRCVIQFQYLDQPRVSRNWWLIAEQGLVDLCSVEPGFEIDLYVATDLRTMTAIWMGYETIAAALSDEKLHLIGDRDMAAGMKQWLGTSSLAKVERRVS